MSNTVTTRSWLKQIREAAVLNGINLPPFTNIAMGSAMCRSAGGDRFVSFKRSLSRTGTGGLGEFRWGLWDEAEDLPSLVLAFVEDSVPSPSRVSAILKILAGWLLERWTEDQVREHVSGLEVIKPLPPVVPREQETEFWLSPKREFGLVVRSDGWAVHSLGSSICTWRSRVGGKNGDSLPLESLDRLCTWLARNWSVIAFGNDCRPKIVRESTVSANRAYENAQLLRQTNGHEEVSAWWSRHAIRAADGELPNFFLERQEDDLVVSWDASPTDTRYYSIPYGELVLPVNVAVPPLRRLVRSRLNALAISEVDRSHLLSLTAADATFAFGVLERYKGGVSREWLATHGFNDEDARAFAVTGSSTAPIVGLLRTSQDSPISLEDYDKVLRLLRPASESSYSALREFAKTITATLDAREPWESGYRLAALVRSKLGEKCADSIDPESLARSLGIDLQDVQLKDCEIHGACIGLPEYAPLIVLNLSCADANAPSGRRVAIAHALCHLFFDRSRMSNLARFEGRGADSDRLIEMRANAFAVELLAPMTSLIKDNGTVIPDEELIAISVERQVSMPALTKHAMNLRNRLLMTVIAGR